MLEEPEEDITVLVEEVDVDVGVEIEVEEPPPPRKRTVFREGIVRRSLSIQAPSEWVLEDLNNKRTINYLYAPPTNNIVLLDYFGKRIYVTGEELLDERWLKTPVLKIDTLEPVP
jgi:hypothetical protein